MSMIQVGSHFVPSQYVRSFSMGKPADHKDKNEEEIKPDDSDSTSGYVKQLGSKLATFASIKKAITDGYNTQHQIKARTRLSQSCISNRLSDMEAGKEVSVDRSVFPWIYSLVKK